VYGEEECSEKEDDEENEGLALSMREDDEDDADTDADEISVRIGDAVNDEDNPMGDEIDADPVGKELLPAAADDDDGGGSVICAKDKNFIVTF
jgi:hypothetical protein